MKKFLKHFLSVTMAMAMSISVFAGEVNIEINNEMIDFPNQEPVIVDGRTLVPVRGVFDKMGYNVTWEESTKSVILSKDNNFIMFVIGEKKFVSSNKVLELDVPAQIINGSTMIPLRAVSDASGVEVLWDSSSKTATINLDGTAEPSVNTEEEDYSELAPVTDEEITFVNAYTEIMTEYSAAEKEYSNILNLTKELMNNQNPDMEKVFPEIKATNEELLKSTENTKAKIQALACPEKYTEYKETTLAILDTTSELINAINQYIDGDLSTNEYTNKLIEAMNYIMNVSPEYSKMTEAIFGK